MTCVFGIRHFLISLYNIERRDTSQATHNPSSHIVLGGKTMYSDFRYRKKQNNQEQTLWARTPPAGEHLSKTT
jgi:hypothetical protein